MSVRVSRTTDVAGFISAVMLLFLILGNGGAGSGQDKAAAPATVTFGVQCYDVGAGALKDLPGVIRIEKGFRHFREVDKVYYDPSQTTVDRMEEVLKRAGTYRETIP